MSGYGYVQTLERPSFGVRSPLVSRRRRPEIQNPRDLSPLTAPKRTSETRSLEVCNRPEGDIGAAAGGRILVPNSAPEKADQDRRRGRSPRSLYHVPTCRGRNPEKPDRQPASGPSGAMTALDPVASSSPDRTAVCRESRGAPSAPGLVSGSGFRSPNRPNKGPKPTHRAGSRREVWCERPSCYHCRQRTGAIWGISADNARGSLRPKRLGPADT